MQCKVYDSLLFLSWTSRQLEVACISWPVSVSLSLCPGRVTSSSFFYNPLLIDAQSRELGQALYIGWVTSAFLFTARVILLCYHAPRTQEPDERVKTRGKSTNLDTHTNRTHTSQLTPTNLPALEDL
ncbi:hypothetical protein LDENG_00161390 [Lucifuga dentata]|nr:hypothetical protein LDENG_00161390 [Lucifuga dentata]